MTELVGTRARLVGMAYRMLGSTADAEDAVQEGLARWAAADRSAIRDRDAWLTTVVSRICLDRLGSAQRRRETYVGPWLPEPLLTDDVDPADVVGTAEALTLAFLVVLETLSPLERVVFLLHDVFGHPHEEVGRMLDRSPAAVRQAAVRARRHLDERRSRFTADAGRQEEVTTAFLRACEGEDLPGMLALLAPDVTFVSDGGGLATAVPRPMVGADRVARMLLGFVRTGSRQGATATPGQVNGGPGLLVHEQGRLVGVMAWHVVDGRISAIHAIRNPDKLAAAAAWRAATQSAAPPPG